MISEQEINQLREHSTQLKEQTDSDHVRLGHALAALIDAHDALKAPHLQALEGVVSGPAAAAVKDISDTLDIAIAAAYAEDIPDQTRLVALRLAARTATAAMKGVTGGS